MPTIRVVARFRPTNSREKRIAEEKEWSGEELMPIHVDDTHLAEFLNMKNEERCGTQVRCHSTPSRKTDPSFAFDDILMMCDQELAFERIGLPVVLDAMKGINGTLFAYGQTGSGKTFSMFGDLPLTASNEHLLGVVPRCCARLFAELHQATDIVSFEVNVSFYEIYIHNQINDLLFPWKKGDPVLKIRDSPKTGVYVENLKFVTVANLTEILAVIATANSHRTVSKTLQNAHSSRSHSVMSVKVIVKKKDGTAIASKINFGDLAGSEKVRKTGASGQTLREAMAINQSLTALGNVISTLATQSMGTGKKRNVPFRDCALTHVLKDSLAGNCKTTLIVAVSPSKFNINETVSTFRFASRCKLVKTKVDSNVILSKKQMQQMIAKLKLEIKQLKMSGGGGGGGGGMSNNFNIGVKCQWPSDFPIWPKVDKKNKSKIYNAMKKQCIQQTESLLSDIAENSVDEVPYQLVMSGAGQNREIIVGFTPNEAYDARNCIKVSKSLAKSLNTQKTELVSAMQNFERCSAFSEPSAKEMKEKLHFLKNENAKLNEQLQDKVNLLNHLPNVFDGNTRVDNALPSLESTEEVMIGAGTSLPMNGAQSMVAHERSYTNESLSSNFQLRSNITHSKLLSPKHLLRELLSTKYELLSVKRALQLQNLRYLSQEKYVRQLRFALSRMQAEIQDHKNVVKVSKEILSNVAEKAATIYNGDERESSLLPGNSSDLLLSKRRSISMSSDASFLNLQESDFLADALNLIINPDENKVRKGSANIIKRQMSVISTPTAASRHKKARSFAAFAALPNSSTIMRPRGISQYESAGQKQKFSQTALKMTRRSMRSMRKNLLTPKNTQQRSAQRSMENELLTDLLDMDGDGNGNGHDANANANGNGASADDDHSHYDEKKNNSVIFNDEEKLWKGYDIDWIASWTAKDVANWLESIYDGRMRKYANAFLKESINGEQLTTLDISAITKLTGLRADSKKIIAFMDSLYDFELSDVEMDLDDMFNDEWMNENDGMDGDDSNSEDLGEQFLSQFEAQNQANNNDENFFDRHLNASEARFYDDSSLRITELLVDELSHKHLQEAQTLGLFEIADRLQVVNFHRVKEFYSHNVAQVLLSNLFGLLCSKNGLLNVSEWNKLLTTIRGLKLDESHAKNNSRRNLSAEAKAEDDDDDGDDDDDDEGNSSFWDDHLVVITSFVDIYGIYSAFSDPETGRLTIIGAKQFLADLRKIMIDEAISDIRDNEDAVCFLSGLRIDELEEFMVRCPNNIWNLLASPPDIEYVYREIAKYAQNALTPSRLFTVLTQHMRAQHITRDMIDDSLLEMNIVADPSIVIDIWLRKLFIKSDSNAHTCEFILNELLILNAELERDYFLRIMPNEPALSCDSNDPDFDLKSEASDDGRDDMLTMINDNTLKITSYLTTNSLLQDFGRFGNELIGLRNANPACFSSSSRNISAAPLLFGPVSYTGDGQKNSFEFLQIDLQKRVTCFAIAIQGNATDSWITEAKIEYCAAADSLSNAWQAISLGQNEYIQCTNANSVAVYIFSHWTEARHIRLNIYDWHNTPSLRLDLLFGVCNKLDNIQ